MRKFTVLFLLGSFLSIGAIGGGYQVGLHGQKNIGMGLIGTSLSQDASTMFYNPGALSFTNSDFSIAFGASGIFATTTFQYSNPAVAEAETDNPLGTPFYFYASAKFSDRLSFGLAVNTPYGNSLDWGKEWIGSQLIQDIKLQAIFFQPTLSFKVTDKIGIGAGLVYATGNFEMNRAVSYGPLGTGDLNLSGKTTSIGYNVGLFFQPTEELNIGIDYRSSVDMEVDDADAKFNKPAPLATMFPDTKVAIVLPLPANLDFGASYWFSEKLMLGFNLNYVFWSSYDSLVFDFETNTALLADSRNPRLYSDKLIMRVGGEYRVNDVFHVRAGGYYDPSPVNEDFFSPETPSLNSIGLTAGLSIYPTEKLAIDLSLLYISGQEGERNYEPANFGGTYKTTSIIPGIGLTYNF